LIDESREPCWSLVSNTLSHKRRMVITGEYVIEVNK
jgi:hypothetical protein